jgi:hypothetical protein
MWIFIAFVCLGFWFFLGAWQIASHVSLPIRCIFIPEIFAVGPMKVMVGCSDPGHQQDFCVVRYESLELAMRSPMCNRRPSFAVLRGPDLQLSVGRARGKESLALSSSYMTLLRVRPKPHRVRSAP